MDGIFPCCFSSLVEDVMKAALALVVIYLGMFFVATRGSSPTAVQAAAQDATSQTATAASPQIDPAKNADIRSLIELVGARDQIEDSIASSAEQYREKLLSTVPNNERGQAFVNSVVTEYQRKFNLDEVVDQLVTIYDKHYTDDEIKGLLQFYGTPFGQKVAAEQSKISREAQETTRGTAYKTIHEALQQAKQENPGIGQGAHLGNAAPNRFGQGRAPQQAARQQNQQ
jgi:hypothetical protein